MTETNESLYGSGFALRCSNLSVFLPLSTVTFSPSANISIRSGFGKTLTTFLPDSIAQWSEAFLTSNLEPTTELLYFKKFVTLKFVSNLPKDNCGRRACSTSYRGRSGFASFILILKAPSSKVIICKMNWTSFFLLTTGNSTRVTLTTPASMLTSYSADPSATARCRLRTNLLDTRDKTYKLKTLDPNWQIGLSEGEIYNEEYPYLQKPL